MQEQRDSYDWGGGSRDGHGGDREQAEGGQNASEGHSTGGDYYRPSYDHAAKESYAAGGYHTSGGQWVPRRGDSRYAQANNYTVARGYKHGNACTFDLPDRTAAGHSQARERTSGGYQAWSNENKLGNRHGRRPSGRYQTQGYGTQPYSRGPHGRKVRYRNGRLIYIYPDGSIKDFKETKHYEKLARGEVSYYKKPYYQDRHRSGYDSQAQASGTSVRDDFSISGTAADLQGALEQVRHLTNENPVFSNGFRYTVWPNLPNSEGQNVETSAGNEGNHY